MKIYVSHSKDFDYLNQLYKPIRESDLNTEHEFFLPHENGRSVNTKEIIKESDLILAEVSFPSIGQGIEVGWAEILNVPILCMYKETVKFSGSLKHVTNKFISYTNEEDFITKLTVFLSNLSEE
jgi:hypothetical protein